MTRRRHSNSYTATASRWLDDDALELTIKYRVTRDPGCRYTRDGDGWPPSTDCEPVDFLLVIHAEDEPDVTLDGEREVSAALETRGHSLSDLVEDMQDGLELDEPDEPDGDDERDRRDGY